MKIAAATVSLAASHHASSHDDLHETVRAWEGLRRPDFEQTEASDSPAPAMASAVARISGSGRELLQQFESQAPPVPESAPVAEDSEEDLLDPRMQLVRSLLEILTGEKIDLAQLHGLRARLQADGNSQAPPRAGFGIEVERHRIQHEEEQTAIAAAGSIVTADGRRFSFSLDVAMSRSFTSESHESQRFGDAVRKDPLVLNFGSAGTALQDQRFSFDIDSDGSLDSLASLAPGNAFLAWDRDGDGSITNGRELFGAASGDGFAELARLDGDGNGWIDENDAAWQSLRLWTPGGALETLADRDVGALYLGNTASPFALRGSSNAPLGEVRSSGLWLREDGSAGSMQQIDLLA